MYREKLKTNREKDGGIERNESSAREILHTLESTSNYVFHGSPYRLDKLEPRQAYKSEKKDGVPAVFATPYADVAIFRALTNPRGVKGETKSGFKLSKDETLHFSATKNLHDIAKSRVGYVYVFRKDSFRERNRMELQSFETVSPDDVIEVKGEDLPEEITILDV